MAPVRIAVEGCGHGSLNDIYETVDRKATEKGWDSVDLVIIGGDFQALRNANDATCLSVPDKFKQIGDFHEYYSGARTAPYLTLFIGGNHEASNHLSELYYGGWVAPNIYFMGAANIVRFGPLRISGMSGIWKGYDYRKAHYERLPYNRDDVSSIYHIRELDVRKLLQVRTQIDIGLSHDWPKGIEKLGDYGTLFRKKSGFKADSESGKLGSFAAREALNHLRPAYWLSAHLHVRYTAKVSHSPPRANITSSRTLNPAVAPSNTNDAAPVPRSNLNTRTLAGHKLLGTATGDEQSRIKAWNEFGDNARRTEKEKMDQDELMRMIRARQPQPARNITFNETSKIGGGPIRKFVRGADGEKVEAAFIDGENIEILDKVSRGNNPVNNSAEEVVTRRESSLFAETTDDIQTTKHVKTIQHAKVTDDVADNIDKISISTSPSSTASVKSPPAEKALPKADISLNWSDDRSPDTWWSDGVDDQIGGIETELPTSIAQSSLPKAASNPSDSEHLPGPQEIKNLVTQFLTLDKPHNHDDFVELLEIEPISEPDSFAVDSPMRLRYDKEWLAITRAFADELEFGGHPKGSVPAHKGYEYYQQRITEEEEWVQENVINPGLLDIPTDFVLTAPIYDPGVSINTHEQPKEYTNPQTSAFCNLIGIENKFDMSEEERQARMEAGPRPDEPRQYSQSNRGGRGGRGRGGRGRGGRRGPGRGGFSGRGGYANSGPSTQGTDAW
ncbi:RNA lariat debranching enzyme, putative [Penicillium digitatum]|uniref:RNA lariat debranching enzyme, putative n=3 Tax=Penicillium digitatum TaxID=36651 RepID=K9G7E7_PEND2|nr:RNA lariat debranching enzyme, putative [Penicillium digitatum Pd1]EKV15790.1 RNA lariat debranching enzyme, putative [Penicillium digitatum Pd1]EKV17855.1 RNA lariat debranching enzyme, putative [Penicillium digitatum PHI26]QQK42337.1 RNA lariat debranching enzyme, putative [Penicillium digitatum]